MITKNSKNKKVKLTATISKECDELLDQEAQETGNKSYIVEKAIRGYYKLPLYQEKSEKLAS